MTKKKTTTAKTELRNLSVEVAERIVFNLVPGMRTTFIDTVMSARSMRRGAASKPTKSNFPAGIDKDLAAIMSPPIAAKYYGFYPKRWTPNRVTDMRRAAHYMLIGAPDYVRTECEFNRLRGVDGLARMQEGQQEGQYLETIEFIHGGCIPHNELGRAVVDVLLRHELITNADYTVTKNQDYRGQAAKLAAEAKLRAKVDLATKTQTKRDATPEPTTEAAQTELPLASDTAADMLSVRDDIKEVGDVLDKRWTDVVNFFYDQSALVESLVDRLGRGTSTLERFISRVDKVVAATEQLTNNQAASQRKLIDAQANVIQHMNAHLSTGALVKITDSASLTPTDADTARLADQQATG